TPLEAANNINMNTLALQGECGIMDPIAPGIRPGSDTSHLSILGYDPYKAYTGRGPFEAAGIGMDVRKGDIALRCNFSTVDESMVIVDRRAGRIEKGTDQLAALVNGMQIEDVTAFFKESVAHRGALVLRGPGLGAAVTDADPHEVGAKVHESKPIDPNDQASAKTARIVNEFVRRSYQLLKDHPVNKQREAEGKALANIILPRGAGVAPHVESFEEKYHLKGAAVVETGLIGGIAVYLGMDIVEASGATGGLDSDLMSMGRSVLKALENHSFVLCNLKGPDVAGHDGQAKAKVEVIERIDAVVGMLMQEVDPLTYIVLTADHSTPISVMDHSGDPVPIAIWGPDVRVDSIQAYDERSVIGGGLVRIKGTDVMPTLTNLLGTQEKFGA
ncbi:MAG TPA: 2,3-bisphosphoglycerate-independent phosphoglycerate mutase, partial [Armatimonadota bacterium]|nr:2,3-bisphosphoglycerate-independent phosphoglycerate mutase [Armatimonadota bacterium]